MWHYRRFPEKSLKLEKFIFLIFCGSFARRLANLTNLAQFRYLGSPFKYLHSVFFLFYFRSTFKIKGGSNKKKIKNFLINGPKNFDKIL